MEQSFFDVVDEHDNPVGKVASYDAVHGKGLWHRGAHVIIYTSDNQVVIQKRSKRVKYHPDEIEISVGGGVDAGETPEQAAVREAREELGLVIHPGELRFIGKTKFNHRTKTQYYRSFNYAYAVRLPEERLQHLVGNEETSLVMLVSKRKLRFAIAKHRLKNIGRISSLYAYWKYLLDAM